MSSTIADLMHTWYSQQLGHDGSLIELEREYFGASDQMTWADAALIFYAGSNGSNPVGSLHDEAYKYYSQISGLEPAESYSLIDHIYHTFATGAGHSPIPLANLVAWYDAQYIGGTQANPNLLPAHLQNIETDLTDVTASNSIVPESSQLQANMGAYSVRVQGVAGSYYLLIGRGTAGAKVTPGVTYTGYATTFAGATGARITRAGITFFDITGASIGASVGGTNIQDVADVWNERTVQAVAPANAAYAEVYIQWTGASNNDIYYADKFGLWEGVSTIWRDSNGQPADGYPVDAWADISAEGGNLLTVNQASVETDLTGFGTPFNMTIARSTARSLDGAASVAGTVTVASTPTISLLAGTQGVPVIANRPYTGFTSVWLSPLAVGARKAQARLYWFTSSGAASSSVYWSGLEITLSPGGWTQVHVTGTAPSDAAYCQLRMVVTNGSQVDDVYYCDEWSLAQGYSLVWALPDPTKVAYNLTQAVEANKPLFRNANKNLLTYNQATFEENLVGWGGAYQMTLAKSTAQAAQGSASMACTISVAGGSACYTDLGLTSVVEGKVYTATWFARSEVDYGLNASINIKWYNASSAFISDSPSSPIVPTSTGWTQNKIVAIAPADAAFARISFTVNGAIGDIYYIDKAGMWEGGSTDWLPPVSLANGLPVVQNYGAQRVFNLNVPMTHPFTIYVVMEKEIAYPTNYVAVGWQGAGTPGIYINSASGGSYYYGGSGSAFTAGAAGNSLSVISAVVKSSPETTIAYLNGGGGDPVAAGSALPTGVFGTSGSTTNSTHVSIAEILLYDEAHSDAQRQSIEQYLMNKYGVAA